jgi:serine/threonine protein kinase
VSTSFDELEKKILADTPIQVQISQFIHFYFLLQSSLSMVFFSCLKIPTHVLLSETCRDLLSRLLQRNPADRISFAEFFNHPFVDLEHMPSDKSMQKAVSDNEKDI